MGQTGSIDRCKTLGGRLALVPTNEEMNAIQAYMQAKSITDRVRIDGTDRTTEGLWTTEAGEPMSNPGFTGSEPNGGLFENCMCISDDQVMDVSCLANIWVAHALCEY